ncbi:MAG: DUF1573 domain-containing protein [Planctomycetales bacterium]|nr:DUF1573 domain-containing protein [Planctomycetales bacterium]
MPEPAPSPLETARSLSWALAALAAAGVLAVVTRGEEGDPWGGAPGTRTGTGAPGEAPREPPAVARSGPPGKVVFDETEHEFGTLLKGEKREHVFRFRNEGEGPLRIGPIQSACECAVIVLSGKELPPGGRGELRVTLTTEVLEGRMGKTVFVTTDDPATPMVQLVLSFEILAPFRVDPIALDFGTLGPGERAARHVTIRHWKGEPFRIQSLSGPPPPFELSHEPAAGNAQRVTLSVTAPWQGGTMAGSVLVMPQPAPTEAPIRVPFRAEFRPLLHVRPSYLRLGRLRPDETPAETIRVSSPDDRPLAVTGVEVKPPGRVAVDVEPEVAGRAFLLKVRVLPVEGGAPPGTFQGELRISTDRTSEPIAVPFEGYVLPR